MPDKEQDSVVKRAILALQKQIQAGADKYATFIDGKDRSPQNYSVDVGQSRPETPSYSPPTDALEFHSHRLTDSQREAERALSGRPVLPWMPMPKTSVEIGPSEPEGPWEVQMGTAELDKDADPATKEQKWAVDIGPAQMEPQTSVLIQRLKAQEADRMRKEALRKSLTSGN